GTVSPGRDVTQSLQEANNRRSRDGRFLGQDVLEEAPVVTDRDGVGTPEGVAHLEHGGNGEVGPGVGHGGAVHLEALADATEAHHQVPLTDAVPESGGPEAAMELLEVAH